MVLKYLNTKHQQLGVGVGFVFIPVWKYCAFRLPEKPTEQSRRVERETH